MCQVRIIFTGCCMEDLSRASTIGTYAGKASGKSMLAAYHNDVSRQLPSVNIQNVCLDFTEFPFAYTILHSLLIVVLFLNRKTAPVIVLASEVQN